MHACACGSSGRRPLASFPQAPNPNARPYPAHQPATPSSLPHSGSRALPVLPVRLLVGVVARRLRTGGRPNGEAARLA